ncbi:NAD(P)-dependent alcohol dehydrogenase [Kribbella sp. DT2]|uniref:NAD(P)-dependent alcohol dehydrogenase n=1 Tax=Kribbella sp. DT2 TaxID=3393427 RepID=UPI003CF900CE
MTDKTMRAVRYDRYGPPDVLKVQEVPVPTPGRGEVLVKVVGTSVNPVDAEIRGGRLRPMSGWRFPKGTSQDFTGEIVAVGTDVDVALAGRLVWGATPGLSSATAAEYIRVRESAAAPAPEGQDLLTTAALPTVGLTALMALRAVRVEAGHRVLVVGAAGGVGSATTQLAVAKGAQVTAVAGPGGADFCTGLGAEQVYDYADPEALAASLAAAPPYDAVVDCAGRSLARYRRRLRSGGRMITLSSKGMGYAVLSAILPGPRVRVAVLKARRADLDELAGFVGRGELRALVDQIYPLAAIAEAHRSIETGHSRGKRVIQVSAADRTTDQAADRPEDQRARWTRPSSQTGSVDS